MKLKTKKIARGPVELKPGEKVMAIQTNGDGRPCGWGCAPTEADARAEAERQFAKHNCYPGEERGPVEIHVVKAEG